MTQYITRFVIDTYDKYDAADRQAARYIFTFHDQDWAIKEYRVEEGKLMRPLRFYEREDENEWFYQYETFEDAMSYVYQMRNRQ